MHLVNLFDFNDIMSPDETIQNVNTKSTYPVMLLQLRNVNILL